MTGELAIQRFLRGPWLDAGRDLPVGASAKYAALNERYGIASKRHPRFPNLVLFKYDQIASPMGEPLVRECRGIILDEADDWKVVSRAFDKFFNHGEGHAADIDWSTAKVQEKVDGSLCVVYPYAGEWHVATSGTPDAGGNINGFGRFSDLFKNTLAQYGNPFEALLPDRAGVCFYFELTSPMNRVVVVHADAKLTLLGAREIATGEEMPVEVAASILQACGFNGPHVQAFPLQSFEDIAASFQAMSPLAQEGYVVVDRRFHRVKVKHPGYVALHHAKGGMTRKAFVEIARSGETSEVLAAFPEYAPLLADAKRGVDALIAELERDYAIIESIAAQKEFALEAQKTRHSAALFQVRAKRVPSVRAYVASMPVVKLMELLGTADAPFAEEVA
jgi:hypothetical protein